MMNERDDLAEKARTQAEFRCDFCDEPSESVRRVALDGSYERLRTRHVALYACRACSERKERDRVG